MAEPTLKRGSEGQAVKQLQEQAGLVPDGIAGPATWAVVDALESEGGAS